VGETAPRRLFVALMLGEALGGQVAAAVRKALHVQEGVRPPKHLKLYGARDLHATLFFLGATMEPQRVALEEALDQTTLGLARPELELTGGGAFPDARRPKVLWIGAREVGPGRVARVVDAVALAATSLGFQPDPRPWTPHITVARVRGAPQRGTRSEQTPLVAPAFFELDLCLPWQPGAVALVESVQGEEEAYRPIRTWPLPSREA
jgi:RNA 2',3'-cyclic 3'-phosphodiesterase